MLLKLIRFFRGYVNFTVNGRFPERFINLALKNGVGLFDVLPQNGTLGASMYISDYRHIRGIARRSMVRLKIQSRHGIPFLLYKFRHRSGLAVGTALFIVVLLILQNFVWTIELNGVKTLSSSEITSSLKKYGFSVGKFKGNMDLHKIEREILLEYDKIGWMSINLIGSHAEVEIKEKELPPKPKSESDYSNIKASTDGVLLSTDIRNGTSYVKVGSAVSKGQLLVSGFYENSLGEIHFVDADADIRAATNYTFSATEDEVVSFYSPVPAGKRAKISLLWFSIPLTFSPESDVSSFYTESRQLYLDNTPVPLTIHTEQICVYSPSEKKLSEKAIKEKLKSELMLYKLFALQNTESIAEELSIDKEGNVYKLTAKLSCVEDIGVKENLIVNTE